MKCGSDPDLHVRTNKPNVHDSVTVVQVKYYLVTQDVHLVALCLTPTPTLYRDKQTHSHRHTHTHKKKKTEPHTHTHTRARARTHTYTHTHRESAPRPALSTGREESMCYSMPQLACLFAIDQ